MSKLNHSWFSRLPIQPIDSYHPVSGGDINEAYQVVAGGRTYFIKVQPNHPASYFQHEINGLRALGHIVNTPTPLYNGTIDGDAYLILNWLDESIGSQADLGRMVAKLHQQHQDRFGFVDNHQTKALVKNNKWNDSWTDFYVNQRLRPEIAAAKRDGRWNQWRDKHFNRMVADFEHYYRDKTVVPSLLHGDLWAGNFMFANQQPYLIDPDAVYGDREFDIAMTTVFGGFDQDFYSAYNSVYPLAPGVDQRLSWYRFYYLCMHLILFGESYGPSVDRILSQY